MSKQSVRFFQIFVAFLEYMNFMIVMKSRKYLQYICKWGCNEVLTTQTVKSCALPLDDLLCHEK